MVRGGTREGPAYGSGDQREEHERMRSGGRAHGGRYEAVVQGMELSDVRIQIAGRRRQVGVAQPERHGVHRITGFEFPGPGLVPEIMEPEMRDACPSATGSPGRLDVFDLPSPLARREKVVWCGISRVTPCIATSDRRQPLVCLHGR